MNGRYEEMSPSSLLYPDQQFEPLKLNESWAGRKLIAALSSLPQDHLSSSLDVGVFFAVIYIFYTTLNSVFTKQL